jgi:hypothetical protein
MLDNAAKEDRAKIKREYPLNASSHDLLGSCLTILAGIFGKWQAGKEEDAKGNEQMILGIWQTGSGSDALESYWGALIFKSLN